MFKHFWKCLESNSENALISSQKELVYIRRWMMVKGIAMFRLSNKLVQVSFPNRSNIIMGSENREVIYEDSKGTLTRCKLAEVVRSGNKELMKHFESAKEVLNQVSALTRKRGRSNAFVIW